MYLLLLLLYLPFLIKCDPHPVDLRWFNFSLHLDLCLPLITYLHPLPLTLVKAGNRRRLVRTLPVGGTGTLEHRLQQLFLRRAVWFLDHAR